MTRGNERAARATPLACVAAASLLAALAGCERPKLGAPSASQQGVGGPRIEVTGASVDGTGHVVATLRITRGGVAVATAEDVAALKPMFTLAALSVHPVDGLAAWRSLLLTGGQTLASLPPGGPGTPPGAVLANVKQPGAESSGTLSGADGTFTYVYANALPAGFDPAETLRVGVWLLGNGTADGTSTFDFRPAGGAAAPREAILYERCKTCHDELVSPRGAAGVKICATCHTWQNADPDTKDPAALDAATAATDPNPLDLGRMVHRIHRGKNLPTLYQASSAAPNPGPPFASAPPLPFFPGRNAAVAGRKFSIVGPLSHEVVFGRIASVSDAAGTGTRVVAQGVVFPRDLRDCGVCHGGAPQGYEVLYAVSRRTCSGCHPDVWFQTDPITDAFHFAHTGGPQADDGQCRGCHVAATAAQPKVWVRISDAHVPPRESPYYDEPTAEIVSVANLRPGAAPTVVFKLRDRVGTLLVPNAPVPATETTGPAPSPVPRAFSALRILLAGPTAPDYATALVQSSDAGNPSPLSAGADPATGEIAYTFASTLPAGASGTWAVALEGRRRATVGLYDAASQTFRWPYTGEQVTESFDNPIAYVDTATGTWTPAAPGAAVPRREIVAEARCLECHGRFELHGGQRHQVAYCLVCHSPEKTDWAQRPKTGGAGTNVNLGATLDGVEERSIHFKVMVHRIHTGGRKGIASLEGIEPHVVYGFGGTPWFFDEAVFTQDLADCTECHVGTTYRIESVPADAPPTVANETPTIRHAGTSAHAAGEPATPPIQAACLGCHATGATMDHVVRKTVDGVEQCAQCHARGALSVDVAHGLAKEDAPLVAASFSSIVEGILVPRCASAACHGGSPPAAFPRLDAEGAYDAIVGVPSQQASGVLLVEPFEPDASYMLVKMRGEAASVGGIATPMPIGDALLDPAELAAFEAWIANGAPND